MRPKAAASPLPCAGSPGIVHARRQGCAGAASRQGSRSVQSAAPRSCGLRPLTARLMRPRQPGRACTMPPPLSRCHQTPWSHEVAERFGGFMALRSENQRPLIDPAMWSLVFESERCGAPSSRPAIGRSFSCAARFEACRAALPTPIDIRPRQLLAQDQGPFARPIGARLQSFNCSLGARFYEEMTSFARRKGNTVQRYLEHLRPIQ